MEALRGNDITEPAFKRMLVHFKASAGNNVSSAVVSIPAPPRAWDLSLRVWFSWLEVELMHQFTCITLFNPHNNWKWGIFLFKTSKTKTQRGSFPGP